MCGFQLIKLINDEQTDIERFINNKPIPNDFSYFNRIVFHCEKKNIEEDFYRYRHRRSVSTVRHVTN